MIQKLTDYEVFTLEEAAEYLRVTPDAIERMLARHELPAKQVDGQWRFLKESLRKWMSVEDSKQAMLASAGVFKDDPHLEELTAEIYRNRGRSMIEE
jgi:excisionase family DNA binding protein